MEGIRSWIIGICAGAIICAAVQALTPKGKSGSAVKLACGFLTVALLIGPLREFDFDSYALSMSRIKSAGEQYAGEALNGGQEMLGSVIERESEAYILDKAAELGIAGATARVSAKLFEEGEYPYPYSVELGGEAASEQKKALSSYIEGELGIPAERQYWSVGYEDAVY